MTIKTYLHDNKMRFPQEYWPYYDVWMSVIVQAIRQKSVRFFLDTRNLSYVCGLLDVDYEIILQLLSPSMKKRLKEERY